MRSMLNRVIYAPLQAYVEKQMADEIREDERLLRGLDVATDFITGACMRHMARRRREVTR